MSPEPSELSELQTIVRTPALKDVARTAIHEAIVDGTLVAGNLYSVNDLAVRLGISRTPVREALINLASQGMVSFERNRGVRIPQISLQDVEEVIALRLLLEVPATRRATEMATTENLKDVREALEQMECAAAQEDASTFWEMDCHFHRCILSIAGNDRLVGLVDHLRDLVINHGLFTIPQSRSIDDILAEHRTILKRMDARDASGASRAMRVHLERTGTILLDQEGGNGYAVLKSWTKLLAD